MTKYAGPDVIRYIKDCGLYEIAFQNMAKTKCDICNRLFGEHSPDEFDAHAFDGVTADLDIAPVTPEKLNQVPILQVATNSRAARRK